MSSTSIENSRNESLFKLKEINRSASKQTTIEWIINSFPFPKSFLFKWLLRVVGVKVGKDVIILGRVKFKIRGKASNIIIGDNCVLAKNVDLRNRENGRIILHDKVYLDSNVRLVAAREGKVEIGYGSELGWQTVINSGGNTSIGEFCMIAANVNINASSHGMIKGAYIKEQAHEHGFVEIGDDVWIGSGASVIMNTKIGDGVVLATNAVARKELPPFAICGGVPAKVLKYRD